MATLFPRDHHQPFSSEDDYRAYLISRNPPPIISHSAGMHWRRLQVRLRRIVQGVDAVLHRLIAALEASKTRRLRRELQLRGIRYAQRSDDGRRAK